MSNIFTYVIARPFYEDRAFPSLGNMCTYMISGSEIFTGNMEHARTSLDYAKGMTHAALRDSYRIVKVTYEVVE